MDDSLVLDLYTVDLARSPEVIIKFIWRFLYTTDDTSNESHYSSTERVSGANQITIKPKA